MAGWIPLIFQISAISFSGTSVWLHLKKVCCFERVVNRIRSELFLTQDNLLVLWMVPQLHLENRLCHIKSSHILGIKICIFEGPSVCWLDYRITLWPKPEMYFVHLLYNRSNFTSMCYTDRYHLCSWSSCPSCWMQSYFVCKVSEWGLGNAQLFICCFLPRDAVPILSRGASRFRHWWQQKQIFF